MAVITKETQIEKLCQKLLKDSMMRSKLKIKSAIRSGALDIDSWDEETDFMVMPKAIVTAILESESDQYDGGTSFIGSKIRKEANNLKRFI